VNSNISTSHLNETKGLSERTYDYKVALPSLSLQIDFILVHHPTLPIPLERNLLPVLQCVLKSHYFCSQICYKPIMLPLFSDSYQGFFWSFISHIT
jgi:hypothetical protein